MWLKGQRAQDYTHTQRAHTERERDMDTHAHHTHNKKYEILIIELQIRLKNNYIRIIIPEHHKTQNKVLENLLLFFNRHHKFNF